MDSIDAGVISSLAHDEQRGRGGRGISGGTLRKRLSTLRGAFESAKRRGWIERVPAFPAIEHRYRPGRDFLRSFHQLEALAMSLPLDRAEWVWFTALTGMHPGDVNGARAFVDVDPFASPPWFVAKNTKNRRDGQRVVMPAPLAKLLRERFERESVRPGDPVVVPWEKDSRCKALQLRGRRLKLGRVRATTLRHTFATWAVDEIGTIPRALMDWLGHGSLEMLERVYSHSLRPRFREIAEAVSRKVPRSPRLPPRRASISGDGAGERKAPDGAANTVEGGDQTGRRQCNRSG
jgi:integrase